MDGYLTCMVWVFPLLVTPYAKIVPDVERKQRKWAKLWSLTTWNFSKKIVYTSGTTVSALSSNATTRNVTTHHLTNPH